VQGIIIFVLKFCLFVLPVFLILLILIQRGKGGGLAGAFGGMGGQSAFGTKAGDLFTRITIGVAALWIVLCIFGVWYFGHAERIGAIQVIPPAATQGEPGGDQSAPGPQSDSSEPAQPSSPASPQPPDEPRE
jgi:preprotein translocase subunit SecG